KRSPSTPSASAGPRRLPRAGGVTALACMSLVGLRRVVTTVVAAELLTLCHLTLTSFVSAVHAASFPKAVRLKGSTLGSSSTTQSHPARSAEEAHMSDTAPIRPFRVDVPQEELDDLRRRINAMRWPEKETVEDESQGVRLDTMHELARYWATDYDWRKVEARLQDLPQFVTEIDGVDIHFIHVRSQQDDALPVIVTHGWPGSVIEQLKIIGPLTDPEAHGGSAKDAFDVVIPSLPGHGFSGTPTTTGWDPIRIARAWIALMERLGYTRYVAQGGDWGNAV